jgi:hypothetical protein
VTSADPPTIGGPYCLEQVDAGLLQANPGPLPESHRESLWKLFSAIGTSWKNLYRARDSSGMRCTWFEFVTLLAEEPPSYLAEYENAVKVLAELTQLYQEDGAYEKLFFEVGPVKSQPKTRLEHCKCYVVNEFIKVQIVSSGFRGFGGENRAMNYNGFLRGTRYNRIEGVREFKPPARHRKPR